MQIGWFLLGAACAAVLMAPLAVVVARRLEQRVRRAERRARSAERMAEIGAMTGGLAHEIKNPLSSIGLNAQLLAEGLADLRAEPEESARLTRRVQALRREADRLRDILQDFLDFAGQVKLARERADLNVVVDELSDFFLPQAEAAGVRLRTELAAEPLWSSVDAPHLKQALLNLMINATQAMEKSRGDGEVNGGARELILRTEAGREEGRPVCRVHVIDTGPGIPGDRLESIFQPYFTTKAGGSGLGLPTARRLVEEHGGRIEAHTEEGKGTDFVVTLEGE